MQKTKLLLGFIIVLTITFLGFQIFGMHDTSMAIRSLILPLVTVLYCMSSHSKKGYFFSFLVLYSISEFMGLFIYFAKYSLILNYIIFYGGNSLYIAAYICLSMAILKTMNLKRVINRFPFYIVILLVLDIYTAFLVSDIANQSEGIASLTDYMIELIYNLTIMLLLTIALLNYMNRDSKKAMNILVGSLCIVLSEVIQVAYFYVSEINVLGVIYSILLVLAFGFFYLQSSMSYIKDIKYEILEKLEEA